MVIMFPRKPNMMIGIPRAKAATRTKSEYFLGSSSNASDVFIEDIEDVGWSIIAKMLNVFQSSSTDSSNSSACKKFQDASCSSLSNFDEVTSHAHVDWIILRAMYAAGLAEVLAQMKTDTESK